MIVKYFMHRKVTTLVVFGVLAALLLAACGGDNTTTTSSTPTSSTSTMTGNATLKHVPNGTATLSWDPSKHTLTVKITLTGLAPTSPSMHPSHIHTGSCGKQQPNNVLYPLTTLAADAHGNASATTIINNVTKGIPATGWYVNVHNGPALAPADQFLPIVCGDVANSNTSTSAAQSAQVMLTSAPPGPVTATQPTELNPTGTAQLKLSGKTLTVTVSLTGLVPNSAHAAHIHSGSCEMQGAVLYPLKTITADASGAATVTTTVNNVSSIPSSGWYVNVHHSTDLSTQTGFNPIACGNVTVG